ncbi:MAG: RIP metalloprotease RseP [Eubacterium sp.]|nr:RIP metalloprotease RseP [Eubacterium sp.]
MNIITTIIALIIFFVILIVPHELGHFITAKMMGVKVNEFAFGMGPAILQKQGKETLYSVRLFPIGGYCALEGENEDTGDPRAFNSKPGWKKIIILAAGVTMNMLTAFVIVAGIFFYSGYATLTIDSVQPGSPAEKAGIASGDMLTAAESIEDGEPSGDAAKIQSWEDLTTFNSRNKDGYIIYADRNGKERRFTVRPEKKDGRYLIGITPVVRRDPVRSIRDGAVSTVRMTGLIFEGFRMLFTGDAGVDDLSGPVGIVSAVNESASQGLIYYLLLTAMMCVNLAVINIFPFPALDGGRILFVIIRKVTGKMISDDLEARIHTAGMMLLLVLIIVITFKDVGKIIFR